jgi:hypothetical protein
VSEVAAQFGVSRKSVHTWLARTVQAVVDAFRTEYNTNRPHQALDMAFRADRFTNRPDDQRLPLQLPSTLAPAVPAGSRRPDYPPAGKLWLQLSSMTAGRRAASM